MKFMQTPLTIIAMLFFGGVIMFSSCEKEEYDMATTYKDETFCEPWEVDSTRKDSTLYGNEKLKTKVRSFLWGRKVHVSNVSIGITPDSLRTACFQCQCTTGRRIEVEVYESDTPLIKRYGFQVK